MTASVVVILKKVTWEDVESCDPALRSERSIIRLWLTFAVFVPWLSVPSIPLDFFLSENKASTQMLQFCAFAHPTVSQSHGVKQHLML